MRIFDTLTDQGQIRRLRYLAIAALDHYDIAVTRVRLLARHTNTLFRVDTQDGTKYVLRIGTPGQHDLRDNQVEMLWLTALQRDTDMRIAAPVPNHHGDYITCIQSPAVPETRRCVLFTWVPGRPLADYLSPANYYRLGVLAAQLHQHAATFVVPPDLRPMRWDKVFYYHHEPVVVYDDAYQPLFPPARRALIDAVIARVEPVLTPLYTEHAEQMLIHGDLHTSNVHYYHGNLYVLDFEDVLWGTPVQDVAITLFYGRSRTDYGALRAAFEQGYRSQRPWPQQFAGQLEALMAARSIMLINYEAQSERQPQAYIDWMCERLEEFLITYKAA